MRTAHWFIASILGFLLSGCAGTSTAPTAEARQALAPTGQLRVAFISGVLYASKDAATGEVKGVAIDLGRELARRAGVPFQPIPYPNPAAIVGGAKSGDWDVALMGINAERATSVDFSAPYMEVEQGYLVGAGLPIATISEVDKAGIRIGVVEKAGADAFLSGTLKNATLVRTKAIGELPALLDSGKADVIAATKTGLFAEAQRRAGARVLDGHLFVEPIGMAVAKGRDPAAAAYVGSFVEAAKAEGLVKSAIDAAGLRGVVVAPPK